MKIFGEKKREEHKQGFQSQLGGEAKKLPGASVAKYLDCLLYTSDAADE